MEVVIFGSKKAVQCTKNLRKGTGEFFRQFQSASGRTQNILHYTAFLRTESNNTQSLSLGHMEKSQIFNSPILKFPQTGKASIIVTSLEAQAEIRDTAGYFP